MTGGDGATHRTRSETAEALEMLQWILCRSAGTCNVGRNSISMRTLVDSISMRDRRQELVLQSMMDAEAHDRNWRPG